MYSLRDTNIKVELEIKNDSNINYYVIADTGSVGELKAKKYAYSVWKAGKKASVISLTEYLEGDNKDLVDLCEQYGLSFFEKEVLSGRY
mgnify:CR=1 FL=1